MVPWESPQPFKTNTLQQCAYHNAIDRLQDSVQPTWSKITWTISESLILSACTRVMDSSLCMWVCVCLVITLKLLRVSFIHWKSGVRLFVPISVYVLCGFCQKRFVQKFWHLLITSAFYTSWLALNGQKRQIWLLFKKIGTSFSS